MQRELVQQLIDHPSRWAEIAAMWGEIYPDQLWIDRVVAAFLEAQARRELTPS